MQMLDIKVHDQRMDVSRIVFRFGAFGIRQRNPYQPLHRRGEKIGSNAVYVTGDWTAFKSLGDRSAAQLRKPASAHLRPIGREQGGQ